VRPGNAKTIFEAIEKKGSIDKVTVYRILNSFVEAGLVRRIDFRRGHALYEITTREHHHHIICEECKKVSHIECNLTELQKQVKKSANFAVIRDHALEFFGTCSSCFQKQGKL
jgi:Fur family ferric uptake transcriptional regulator